MQIFINVVAFGGILVFCFMALNYYFDYDNKTEIIKAPIISIGHLASGRHGCEQPYAEVILKDNEKQIPFPCDSNLENFKFIKFTLRKGLFGFDIILTQTPSTD